MIRVLVCDDQVLVRTGLVTIIDAQPDLDVVVLEKEFAGFGASGDLTRRKLMPALYSLAFRRLLPERFGVVGVALGTL